VLYIPQESLQSLDDIEIVDTRDEIRGGAALLAYGATSIEFADTAVFKYASKRS